MDQFTVFRPDISEYQGSLFEDNEKNAFHQIGVKYSRDINDIKKNEQVILITTSQTKEDKIREYIKALNIVLIIHPNSGYDNFSHDLIKGLDKEVVIGNRIRAEAVYLYSISCFLKSLGDIPETIDWDMKRSFHRSLKNNVLIYGRGHVGKKLEAFFKSTNFDYTIYDPYEGFNHLSDLSNYHTIILACSLNEGNKHLINSEFLSKLRDDVTLINPARGKLIDFDALLLFLKKNQNSQAYIDVFENEPYSYKGLNLSNLFPSSHIAGVYCEIDESIIDFECEVIKDFIKLSEKEFLDNYSHSLLKNRIFGDTLI